MNMRTGGQILVDQLKIQLVKNVFCVPGESYLAVLDALYDHDIKVTVCRQEGGAGMMAEAEGRLTNRPGICMVTRAPGATNASAALHIAQQDSTPMILFIGQIDSGHKGREAFQEMDYGAVFGSIAKLVIEITDAARIPEHIARAFNTAMNGRPGPVVIVLPENMLTSEVACKDAPFVKAIETSPSDADLAHLQHMIEVSKNPVLVLGGSRWNQASVDHIKTFAENFDLPVTCQFRRQSLFDAHHPNYAGDFGLGINPKLLALVQNSDCVIVLGGRMGDIPSQAYSLFDIPKPQTKFIHIHASAEELGRVYQGDLHIHATPLAIAPKLALLKGKAITHRAKAAHENYLAWSKPPVYANKFNPAEMVKMLPADALLTNGAGNYATWVQRFYPFKTWGTQLGPTSGSMGYGVPAAIGAKTVHPEKTVIAFAGDGCFMMHGQEFATAVQYGLNVILIILDNAMYGTIRMHQEREYPGRVSATHLKNPDFAALARAYGGHGETVHETIEFEPALTRALTSNKPAIIHIHLDPEMITPGLTLTAIRNKALTKQIEI
jgi:acetolactate synthase I/II/III large subunit